MKLTAHIAKLLRDLHFGGNWTAVSFKEKIADIAWQQATAQVHSFHSIAALVYHTNYFVVALSNVLRGGTLDAKDIYSYDVPAIESQADWERLLERTWADAESLAKLIEQLPESKLWENFADEKYGTYYRNIHGVIEHAHYHLGQIALIKRLLREAN